MHILHVLGTVVGMGVVAGVLVPAQQPPGGRAQPSGIVLPAPLVGPIVAGDTGTARIGDEVQVWYVVTSYFSALSQSSDELSRLPTKPLEQNAVGFLVFASKEYVTLARARLVTNGQTWYSDFFSIPYANVRMAASVSIGLGVRLLPPDPPPATTAVPVPGPSR